MKRRDRKRTKREGKTQHAMLHDVATEKKTSDEQAAPSPGQAPRASGEGGVDRRKEGDQG